MSTDSLIILEAGRKAIAFFQQLSVEVTQTRNYMLLGFGFVLTVQILTLWLVLRRRPA